MPNGDFENHTGCPTNGDQLSLAYPWVTPTNASSDYFNSCAPASSGVSVPNQTLGLWQYAHSGIGYAGLVTFDHNGPDFREYIQVELTDTLISGECYQVSFYANLMNRLKEGTNNLGAYISQNAITDTVGAVLNYPAQILLQANLPIIDTINWIQISGTYIATGGERYITIGNFNYDSTTVTQVVDSSSFYIFTYYYIDDVSLIPCAEVGVKEITKEESITLYPNPATNKLIVNSEQAVVKEVKIVNVLGEEILKQVGNDKSVTLDVSSLSKGIYFVQVQTENGIVRKKFLKQ